MNIDELWNKYSKFEYAMDAKNGVMTKQQFTQAIAEIIEEMQKELDILKTENEKLKFMIDINIIRRRRPTTD